jgi:hypothetical protein
MTEQEKTLAKKLGRPATGQGQTIGVRLHPPEIAALDAIRGTTTRAAAIRQIVKAKLNV